METRLFVDKSCGIWLGLRNLRSSVSDERWHEKDGASVCSPNRTRKARGQADWLLTAGSTRQSGSRSPTPCCCSVTSVCQPATRKREKPADFFSTEGSKATAGLTMASGQNGQGGARRTSLAWSFPSSRISNTTTTVSICLLLTCYGSRCTTAGGIADARMVQLTVPSTRR